MVKYVLIAAMMLVSSSLVVSFLTYRNRDFVVITQNKIEPVPASSSSRPNVILISIDSLRSDHLSCYGYQRETSPNLDRLANENILFQNAFSTTTWTFSAHRSLLTSTFPEATDLRTYMDPIPSNVVTIAEVFADHGYETAGFVSIDLLDSKYGFGQGFQLYDDDSVDYASPKDAHFDITTPTLHHAVEQWLGRKSQKPFFLFLHYWDVHYDYNPPSPYDKMFNPDYKGDMSFFDFIKNPKIHKDMHPDDLEQILALYDGEIAFTDFYIGKLFHQLKKAGLYENSLIVVTADHGDEFFEHGKKGHMRTLYDEVLRVPLIMKFPSGSAIEPNQKVDDVVSIVDIMPTILGSLGMTPSSEVQGRNLIPALRGIPLPKDAFIYASLRNQMFALRSARSKFIQRSNLPTKEFYDLMADPGETKNILKNQRNEADRQVFILLDLLNLQRTHLRSRPFLINQVSREPDDDLKEQMEALGYVQ
jgi:arylsulfatase A-like enzyme